MKKNNVWQLYKRLGAMCGLAASLTLAQGPALAAQSIDWPTYGGAPGGGHYTSATQIDAANVGDLQVAWTHRSGDYRGGAIRGVEGIGDDDIPASVFMATPILVNDTLYYCTPFNRIFALAPETGAERWVFDPEVDMSEEFMTNCRGVSSWIDPLARDPAAPCAHRILLGTLDGRLLAVDGRTGARCGDFGAGGEIALAAGLSDHESDEYAITSAPAILGDLVITGSFVRDGYRTGVPSGVVRAYSVRTGAFRWGWNPVPPDMAGRDEAGIYTPGTTNAWSTISVDAQRNLVIVPTGNSSPDYYGGDRGGKLDYYSSSVVALNGATGEVVWHYQTVHHDIWDMDVPAQPTLVDLTMDGVHRPAVVQVTKMGMTFVLDRDTGEPLHPVEERAVPQEGAVPGEYLSPTQPFPLKPEPLHQLAVSPADAWGFTFYDEGWCRERLESLAHGPIYTPVSLRGTVLYPSNLGGQNWGAPAIDPVRQVMVANTKHVATVARLVPREQCDGIATPFPQSDSPYCAVLTPFLSPFGAPCTKPPWSTLAAVDLAGGGILWQVPLGTLKHQAPWPLSYLKGGMEMGGPMVTAAGLVFIAAAADRRIRAFDIDTGEELWADELPTTGNAVPMSYVSGGRQYVVIAAGGHWTSRSPPADYLIAYALPED